jgi:hypothetical protein
MAGQGEFVAAVKMLVLEDGDALRVRSRAGLRFTLHADRRSAFQGADRPTARSSKHPEEIQQALNDLRNGTFVQN